ncbi:hypothetical protein BDZ45DRAFT_116933 [Acephala macrosclerotiorum]|nr:hypothetical protein BDZ45DRAFT_116933 [Acephala macrosclerotiorum]
MTLIVLEASLMIVTCSSMNLMSFTTGHNVPCRRELETAENHWHASKALVIGVLVCTRKREDVESDLFQALSNNWVRWQGFRSSDDSCVIPRLNHIR